MSFEKSTEWGKYLIVLNVNKDNTKYMYMFWLLENLQLFKILFTYCVLFDADAMNLHWTQLMYLWIFSRTLSLFYICVCTHIYMYIGTNIPIALKQNINLYRWVIQKVNKYINYNYMYSRIQEQKRFNLMRWKHSLSLSLLAIDQVKYKYSTFIRQ